MNTLKKGNKNDEVKLLQELLNKLGYKISTDGDFGQITYDTVVQFQTKMGLDADGIVGSITWASLEKEVEKLKYPAVNIQYDSGLEGKEWLSQDLLDLFFYAGGESKNPTIYITSMWRSPAKQATAMYDNIAKGNIIAYKEPGQIVTKLIQDEIKKNTPKTQVIKLAEDKIIELTKQNKFVSLHCVPKEQYQRMNIVDISKDSTPNPRDLVKALLKDLKISKIITPFTEPTTNYGNDKRVSVDGSESAIHVEYCV